MKIHPQAWVILICLLLAGTATYLLATDQIVWEGEASIVQVDIRYNHVGLTMQASDGHRFDIEDGRLLEEHVNKNISTFHCKSYRYGNGSCK